MFRIIRAKLFVIIILGVCLGLLGYFILLRQTLISVQTGPHELEASEAPSKTEEPLTYTEADFDSFLRVLRVDKSEGFPLLRFQLILWTKHTDLPAERHSLCGMKAVSVQVENFGRDAEEAGLTRGRLKTIAELRLRRAGIPVDDRAIPYVYINGSTLRLKSTHPEAMAGPVYFYSLNLSLMQRVRLQRDLMITTYAPTWIRGFFGTSGTKGKRAFKEMVESSVAENLDEFINDFLAANPVERQNKGRQ